MLSSAPAIVRDSASVNGFIGGCSCSARLCGSPAALRRCAARRADQSDVLIGAAWSSCYRSIVDAQEIYRRVGGTAISRPR